MGLYIVQVQQLEWEEEGGEGEASGDGGMAAGCSKPRRRRHGVIHRVEPVPPSRCVLCVCVCAGLDMYMSSTT